MCKMIFEKLFEIYNFSWNYAHSSKSFLLKFHVILVIRKCLFYQKRIITPNPLNPIIQPPTHQSFQHQPRLDITRQNFVGIPVLNFGNLHIFRYQVVTEPHWQWLEIEHPIISHNQSAFLNPCHRLITVELLKKLMCQPKKTLYAANWVHLRHNKTSQNKLAKNLNVTWFN